MTKKTIYLFLFTLSMMVMMIVFSFFTTQNKQVKTHQNYQSPHDHARKIIQERELQKKPDQAYDLVKKPDQGIKNNNNKNKKPFKPVPIKEIDKKTPPVFDNKSPLDQNKVIQNFLLGMFDADEYDFVRISPRYADKKIYLDADTYAAFQKMSTAAEQDGISLRIISGFRNHATQSRIWNRKWNAFSGLGSVKAKNILKYSSMPGTSRHHWGTDIDINNLKNTYFESGSGLSEYTWLVENAHDYGFCQPYTDKNTGRTGYEQEKWHWSYVVKSSHYLQDYLLHIDYDVVAGFYGSEYATELAVIEKYVNGIDPSCL